MELGAATSVRSKGRGLVGAEVDNDRGRNCWRGARSAGSGQRIQGKDGRSEAGTTYPGRWLGEASSSLGRRRGSSSPTSRVTSSSPGSRRRIRRKEIETRRWWRIRGKEIWRRLGEAAESHEQSRGGGCTGKQRIQGDGSGGRRSNGGLGTRRSPGSSVGATVARERRGCELLAKSRGRERGKVVAFRRRRPEDGGNE